MIYPDQAINDTTLLGENGGLSEYAKLLCEFKTGIVRIDEEDTSEEKVKNSISLLDRAKLELQMNIVNTFNKASGNKQKWSAIVRNRANIFTIRLDENGNGETILKSFDRPEVRIDKVIEENYLEGNFGGLPY